MDRSQANLVKFYDGKYPEEFINFIRLLSNESGEI